MNRWTCRTEGETAALGRHYAEELAPDGVLLLEGELGAGKTVLVRGLAEALGIDPQTVQSPTYTLIQEHQGDPGRLLHMDLYRLEPGETESLGLDELFAGPGVKAVEWAERLPFIPEGARRLRLRRLPDGGREVVEETPSSPDRDRRQT